MLTDDGPPRRTPQPPPLPLHPLDPAPSSPAGRTTRKHHVVVLLYAKSCVLTWSDLTREISSTRRRAWFIRTTEVDWQNRQHVSRRM